MSDDALQFSDLAKVFPISEAKLKPIPMASSGGDKRRILVADEDPVHTLTLFHFLAGAGYEIVVTENGADAIAELRKPDHPLVAILDATLPGMAGAEICRRMREANKDIFLILSSKSTTTQEVVAGLETGADLFLPRTIPPEELLAHLKVGFRMITRQRALMEKVEELTGRQFTPEG